MKWLAIAVAALLLVAQSRTTQDAVYTDAQAKRGEEIYAKTCASCHAADLSGSGQAPALADADFNHEWNGQPLSDLFDRIRATMPATLCGACSAPAPRTVRTRSGCTRWRSWRSTASG